MVIKIVIEGFFNQERLKATGAQDSQATGAKGDLLMGEREMDNLLPGDPTTGHNVTAFRCKLTKACIQPGARLLFFHKP